MAPRPARQSTAVQCHCLPVDTRSGRPAANRWAHRPLPTLLLLCCCTFFIGLGRQAITDSDEAYYAEASREMVESGDWLTPHFNYERRWEKPVLYYWLTASTFVVSGPTEWAARLWSALSGVGLVWLTYWSARRTFGRDDTAWLAGAIVATCFGCVAEARLALPDLPLTFCITLGVVAALRASVDGHAGAVVPGRGRLVWWAVAGLAAGLGFLMKGPVALAVPGLVLLPVWYRERRTVSIPFSGLMVAALLFLVVGLPWYVAMWREHGVAYLQSFFLADNLQRFATDRYQSEPRPIWFYLPIVVGGMMPWSALLIALPLASMRSVLRRQRRLTDVEWRLVLWAVMPVLFYTASVGKQPRYILPVLVPLAMLLARTVMRHVEQAGRGRTALALRIGTWTTAIVLALVALAFLRVQPVFINAHPLAEWIAVGATALAALSTGFVAWSRAWSRLPPVMVLTAAAVMLGVHFGVLSGVRPEPVEQMAALIQTHRTAGEPVGEYDVFVRNLVFYAGFRQTALVDATAAEFLAAPGRLLVVRERDLAKAQQASATPLRELGRVRYFNAANLRLRTFLRAEPTDEIETVLLMTNR